MFDANDYEIASCQDSKVALNIVALVNALLPATQGNLRLEAGEKRDGEKRVRCEVTPFNDEAKALAADDAAARRGETEAKP